MKTLDSIIDRFELAVAKNGVEKTHPEELVAAWAGESNTGVSSETITELLRVWLEYRFSANLPLTPDEAIALFPEVHFSDSERQKLEFEYRRLQRGANDVRSLPSAETVPDLPAVGSTWEDFSLVELLGEGAFARVYLARQLSMSGRLVALKLTFRASHESQLLARLHHSAVVPIYSVHQHGGVYGLCMPYLGNTTLLDLLHEILPPDKERLKAMESASGVELLEILVHRQAKISTVTNFAAELNTSELESSVQSPGYPPQPIESRPAPTSSTPTDNVSATAIAKAEVPRDKRRATAKELAKLNYVGAITWIGAQLADALEHAHRHGVLHCDIKPANILLAPDGQARLLDFNVSLEESRLTSQHRVGGTLAYMAPEQLAAVQGASKLEIDARSDIYSLGIVLFEMLTGSVPKIPGSHVPAALMTQLRQANPAVTPALAAIIHRCLAEQPPQRYASAGQLYDDLNAQCNNLPLVHQREPSINERTRKWIRRHPMITSLSSISLVAASLILLSVMGFWWRGELLEQAERTARGDRLQRLLPDAVALLSAARNYPELAVEANQKTDEIFSLLRDRGSNELDLSIVDDPSLFNTLVRLAEAQQLERGIGLSTAGTKPTDESLSESIAQILARLNNDGVDRITRNDLLNAFLEGRFSEVIEMSGQLSGAHVSDYATWMFAGQSNLKVGDAASARECFSVCIALRPRIDTAWFYRGVARLESKQFEAAIQDFSQALRLRADFPAARYNMALALEQLGELSAAVDSLDVAIQGGWRSVSGYAFRGALQRKLGNISEADRDLAQALACVPTTELDWIRRGTLRIETDSLGARHDFEHAVALNSNSLAARQNLAHVLADKLSSPEESLEHLDVLVSLEPESAERWSGRGVVLARLGRLIEAVRDLSRASALKITNPLVAYQIACGYSLVAAQMAQTESAGLPEGTTGQANALPSQEQIGAAALKWYVYSAQIHPGVAQIAMTDPDVAWLRNQPEFVNSSTSKTSKGQE
ncbi:MAG: protein kinase [Planctomycetales bacterium]|nr:protein kinase [Planctomycetales bacterium]